MNRPAASRPALDPATLAVIEALARRQAALDYAAMQPREAAPMPHYTARR